MESFENIKKVCVLLSKQNATAFFAEQLGEEYSGGVETEIDPIMKKENEINDILKKRNLFGVQGPATSGMRDKEGKWMKLVALTQTFNKDAPELKNFLNKVSKSFKIETKSDGKFDVIDSCDEKSPDLIDIANYIVSSDDTYALNLTSKKIMKLKVRQKGSASQTKYGAIVELNVETIPDVESIAHNLTNLKLPDNTAKKDEIVKNISCKVAEVLKKQGYNDFLNNQKIQEERSMAIEAFESFDNDLGQFVGQD